MVSLPGLIAGHLKWFLCIGRGIVITIYPITQAALDTVLDAVFHPPDRTGDGAKVPDSLPLPNFSRAGFSRATDVTFTPVIRLRG